ncbi:MAG: amidohydrolase family protein [Candidatus Latescibacterota bacterium]
MEIIDAHHHLWDRGRFAYPWLSQIARLDRDFLLPEYESIARAVGIQRSVFVQADTDPRHGLQEARWALSLATEPGPLSAVVAWAPIEDPGLPSYLEQLAGPPGLKGIRRLIQAEPDPGFCARSPFVEGVRRLAPLGLSFDLCLYPHQLPAAIDLVRAVPEVSFVLDHLGKPRVREKVLDPWRDQIRRLAALENVTCKLSGLATEADWEGWRPADLRPYLDVVVEAFGFARLMFGSDWPVSTLAVSYPRWLEVVEELTSGISAADRQALFSGTARRIYRLDP